LKKISLINYRSEKKNGIATRQKNGCKILMAKNLEKQPIMWIVDLHECAGVFVSCLNTHGLFSAKN